MYNLSIKQPLPNLKTVQEDIYAIGALFMVLKRSLSINLHIIKL